MRAHAREYFSLPTVGSPSSIPAAGQRGEGAKGVLSLPAATPPVTTDSCARVL